MRSASILALALLVGLPGCGGGGSGGGDPAAMATARILVDGVEFEVWLAQTPAQQAQGLMGATEADLEPLPDGTPRGMLFVYPRESLLAFWMHDTAVALDLAYARSDGTIAEVHDLVPFDDTAVVSGEPVQYALEALAGTFDLYGIAPGSVIVR